MALSLPYVTFHDKGDFADVIRVPNLLIFELIINEIILGGPDPVRRALKKGLALPTKD